MGLILNLIRFFKIKDLEAWQYPHVRPDEFEKWKYYEMWSLYVLFIAMAVLVGGMTLFRLILALQGPEFRTVSAGPDVATVIGVLSVIGGLVGCLVGLIVSACYGTAAAKLRKKLKIEIPN